MTGDTASAAAGVDDPTADSFPTEATGDTAAPPAEEQPAAEPEPTPEPTPVPTFDGLSVQPAVIYNEGEQPSYTVTPDNNLNMRAGPGTSTSKLHLIPDGSTVNIYETTEGLDNASETWYHIEFEGREGYVRSDYIKMN